MENNDNPIIGYSAFLLFDDCYEYNENACYIADSPESLKEFIEGADFNVNDYRFDTIKWNDILDDYGCSCGEFAMEPETLKRFEQVSGANYTVEPYDDFFNKGEPDLFIVNIDKKTYKTVEEFTIPKILESFRIFDGTYKREQIDAAIKLKDVIIPHLIEILENALAAPEKYIKDEDLYDHVYAVMLLGHFKEPKAHKVIVDLFSLTDNLPVEIFGDITTTDLPVILLNTCGGSIELIKSFILNNEANDYCRISACQALTFAVVEGYVSREDVITLFGSLFTGKEADEESNFWGLLAHYACVLCPEEIMEVITQAYNDELLFSGVTQYSEFEEALELGKDKCLEMVKVDLEQYSLDDIHAKMSRWGCFNKNTENFSSFADLDTDSFLADITQQSTKFKKNTDKTKKKKRKKAKASKRKNRR